MAIIHFVAKVLGVYRPSVPCSVDLGRIREFTDLLAADDAAVPITHA